MFSTSFVAVAAASLSLISSVSADYDPNSQANVAMYYGNGPNQQNLKHFCDSSSVDIIPIGFINIFPPAANGLVAENFGNQCWAEGNYTGPGYKGVVNPKNDFLYTRCPNLQEDIYYCQTQTKKKILLSLGGDSSTYSLNGAADGQYLADFLWGAYGPYDASWVAAGGVRPLDRGLYNTNASMTIDIDGFDFDIEHTSTDNQAGYIAAIKRLRDHFAAYKLKNPCSKEYIISGAPQCPLPEGNMGLMIANAKFDLLFIQFYNNGANGCTARNYSSSTNKATSGFNYNKWVATVNSGASAGAKLYIGLLGSDKAGTASDYIYASEAKPLIQAYHSAPQFGGVMLWEATYAENNNAISGYSGMNYYQVIKSFLAPYAPTVTSTTVCSKTSTSSSSSSTKVSSSSSKTSSSSSTQVTTTSSRTTSSSSSRASSSSTVKSTSSSSTKASSSSTKASSSSSSSIKTTSSSSSVKPTTSSSSSSVKSSSSSSSSTKISTSSVISTTQTAAGEYTSPSSSAATPTTTGTACAYVGCYSEATGVRALSGASFPDFVGNTPEKCQASCSGFSMYGVEYGGECYCGNELNVGSLLEAESDCNMPCAGDASATCGGPNRLNVYSCAAGSSTSSSSTSSSQATSTSSSILETSTSASESSSSTGLVTPTYTDTFSYSATSTDVVTPTYTDTFSYSATSTNIVTPTYTDTFSYSATSTDLVTPTYTNTFSYSATSTGVVTPTYTDTFSYSATPSGSHTYVDSSSSSSSVETTSSFESTSTASGPVTSGSSSVGSSSSEISSSTSCTSTESSVYQTGTPSSSSGTVTIQTSTPSVSSTYGGEITSSTSCTSDQSSKSSGGVETSSSYSVSTTEYTTSTVYTTSVETVTSCAPTVTNCPVGSVTTKRIPLYTTVCPVTATETGKGQPTPPASSPSVTKYTTSTVYTTSIYTITSCAPSVTDCPSKLGHVTTEIIKLYTTVCPVTEASATPASYPASTPSYTGEAVPSLSSTSSGAYDSSTSTTTSTTTQYRTIKLIKSTATVVPMPSSAAPYPTGPAAGSSSGYPVGTGTGVGKSITLTHVPTLSLQVGKVTSSAQGVPSASVTASPVPTYVTGGASNSRSAIGMMIAGVVGVVAMLL